MSETQFFRLISPGFYVLRTFSPLFQIICYDEKNTLSGGMYSEGFKRRQEEELGGRKDERDIGRIVFRQDTAV